MQARRRRSALFLVLTGTLAVLFFVLFVSLGTWQVERRVWKLDLIARVEHRVHALPAAAPGPIEWPRVSAAADEYRHVTANGRFLDASQTLVQAATELGAGYWVLTPLVQTDGSIVLVNRGFIPADARDRFTRQAVRAAASGPDGAAHSVDDASATKTVTGLLRMTEPGGAFLRHNDPESNRWYSRDVQAIAAARGLKHVAPYFIDAEAAPAQLRVDGCVKGNEPPSRPENSEQPAGACPVVPVGGLTVITFHNSHLVYAITWYTLALMVAGAIWLGIRDETRA